MNVSDYQAYESDYTTTDTESDTISDTISDKKNDPRYAIIDKPSIHNTPFKYTDNMSGYEYDVDTNITSFSSLTYIDPPKTIKTSLFSVKSLNRDKSVHPSPFNFDIKLPRVYKNVTKFQIAQLSFPYNSRDLKSGISLASSFSTIISSYDFSPSCISSCFYSYINSGTNMNSISIAEYGRLTPSGNQMLTKLEIPDMKLNNDQMANVLTLDSNSTPPFNIISYETFKDIFKVTKDIYILFNEPGDNYQSKLTSTIYKNHTKDTIMNIYYSRHDIDKHPIITDIIAFNAYYFPVLKELIITELGLYFINTTIDKEQLVYYILNTFLGLDSLVYYEICTANVTLLDEFRKNYTFEYRNINKYIWSYDNTLKRFNCNHEMLHTSLKNDIHNSLTKITNDELQIKSLNTTSFNTLKTNNSINNTILDHLQTNLNNIFKSYFFDNYQYNGGNYYNSTSYNDLHNDELFTNMFHYTSTFGKQYNTYSGISFTFNNFLDYHSTLSSYYDIVHSTSNSISTIYGNIFNTHHIYISSKYTNVFSNDMIENKSYITSKSLPVAFIGNTLNIPGSSQIIDENTDDCVNKCKSIITSYLSRYYSCLPVNTVITSLNYKLGIQGNSILNFNNLNTFFNSVSTFNYDYYLQINPEQSFNDIDVAMSENYNISNETTGQTKLMYAKILTNGLGEDELSQTCIQNPIIFSKPLGKLDKLSFKIYLDDEAITPMWLFYPFVLQLQEWKATFQIDEQISYNDVNNGWSTTPTIPIPNNPNSFSYLGLTKTSKK